MANTKSAKKRIKLTIARTLINNSRRNKMRTAISKVENAIKNNEKEAANNALKQAMSIIAKNSQKGILHKNTAARKISGLNSKIKALA